MLTALKADTVPTFATGSAATSSTDHLFYNSGTGYVYYDPDGNGSHAPIPIARLDVGLHVTAADFIVV